jgi:hypothetical protein
LPDERAEGTLVRVVTLDDLLTALEGDPRAALESFLARALHDGAVWPSPRMSDGVASYRVVNRTPVRASVRGKIWSVDQTLHALWHATSSIPSRTQAEAPWVPTLKCGESKVCA